MTLLDNATYMPCEHIQKEKEYGIPWRSAFKKELMAFADATYKRLVGDDGFPETEDPFVFFHKVIKKDALDAATFDALTQADFIAMMIENLELMEKSLYQLKAMLKEPDFAMFEEVKKECLDKLRVEQMKMNPSRPDTAAMNAAIAKKQ